ncbi:MAG: DUF1549 and DUF1553 domain-containing protein, partial [Planctomycetota bacterium]|nr:DUF1549 and DUF1553 domain-containing protein [Planctomycetota bacterium]
FLTLERSGLPNISETTWKQSAIDRFVFSSLQKHNLRPKPSADKRTLIRRVTFDLTGLPPTVDRVRKFINDQSPRAYENLVDELLNQDSFGEHMARFWLDLVRFADTNGIHHDHYREVTPYRDWVIKSFNSNLPFNQFIEHQVAGDLFQSPTQSQLVASGFNRLHLVIDRGTALPEESFHRNVVDRVTAFGTVFLGLTVECAQCHEHKYDPISQDDFYRLYAFFNNIDATPETPGGNQHPPWIRVPTDEQARLISIEQKKIDRGTIRSKQINDRLDAMQKEDPARKTLSGELKQIAQSLDKFRRNLEAIQKTVPTTLIMKERKTVRETRVRTRGVYDQLGEKVTRGTPAFLPPLNPAGKTPSRLDLAQWLTRPDHPLTSRVAVNRFWQNFFGVGLVKTAEDFGAQGEVPSHPKLLDHLALRFIESGWDVKSLLKEIVLSQTYRQSSVASAGAYLKDPDNRKLARGSRFRLDAETIRDQILQVSGLLNPEMFGKSVKPPQPPNLWKSVSMKSSNTYAVKADTGAKIYRRSLYSFWKRAMPPPQMTLFDAPTRESCIARRERTNTPLQALVLMNESQYFFAAKQLAQQIVKKGLNEQERISLIYESLTAHPPDEKELKLLTDGLDRLRNGYLQDQSLTEQLVEGLALEPHQNQVEIAAYTTLINSLFNLDITKTRE